MTSLQEVEKKLAEALFIDIPCDSKFEPQKVGPVLYEGPKNLLQEQNGDTIKCSIERSSELLIDYEIDPVKVKTCFEGISNHMPHWNVRLYRKTFDWLVGKVNYITWTTLVGALREAVRKMDLAYRSTKCHDVILCIPSDTDSRFIFTAVAWFECGLRDVVLRITGASCRVLLAGVERADNGHKWVLDPSEDPPICVFVDDASYSGDQMFTGREGLSASTLLKDHRRAHAIVLLGFITEVARTKAEALAKRSDQRLAVFCAEKMDTIKEIQEQFDEHVNRLQQERDALILKKSWLERLGKRLYDWVFPMFDEHFTAVSDKDAESLRINYELRKLQEQYTTDDPAILRESFMDLIHFLGLLPLENTLTYMQHKRPDRKSSFPYFLGELMSVCEPSDSITCPLPFYKYKLHDGKWVRMHDIKLG